MSGGLDEVRRLMGAPEDIEDMGGVPLAGDEGEDGEDRGHDRDDPGVDGLPEGPPPLQDGEADDRPPEARCVAYPLNDRGNAQRLVEHFGEDLIHVPRVGWFTWTGQVWRPDPDEIAVLMRAQGLPELIQREVPHIQPSAAEATRLELEAQLRADRDDILKVDSRERSDDQVEKLRDLDRQITALEGIRTKVAKRRREHFSFARSSGNAGKIKSALELSAARLARPLSALDVDPLLINCETGVLRVSVETLRASKRAKVEVLDHDRSQLLTKMIAAGWDAEATCPKFDAFLARVQPDEEMRGFLQRWFGLSLTGLVGEQKLVFLHGGGQNGKSVLMDLMAKLFGDYGATAKIESLTGESRRSGAEATPDLVPLIGARLVRASEPEEGARLQEARVKELTGGEPILVRALNKDFVEVRPIFKLTISGNHKPEIRGGDFGIWRRVLLVPFAVQITEAEKDPQLGGKLWAERAGILRWCVEGLLDYLEGGLREPDQVLEATAKYREESDPLAGFLMGACEVTGDPSDRVRTAELIVAFNFWLGENGKSTWKASTAERQLSAKAQHWKHPRTGLTITKGKSSISLYEGLRLQAGFRERLEGAPKDSQGRPIPSTKGEGGGSSGGFARDGEEF